VRRGAASAGGLSGVPASTGGAGASRRCRGAAAPVVGVSLVADMAPPRLLRPLRPMRATVGTCPVRGLTLPG
jgi:hypothetical protein